MDRIDSFNAVDIGGGKMGFQDQILSSGSGSQEGTWVSSDWLNGIQEELMTVIEAAGLAGDKTKSNLLALAIQSGKLNYAVATGAANAWVVAPALALKAYGAGRVLWIKAPATNTSKTVNVNISDLGNRRVKKSDGSDPEIGDIVGGNWFPTIDDGTNICIVKSLPSELVAGLSAAGLALKLNYFEMVTAGSQGVANTTTTIVNDFSVAGSQASDASFGSGGVITIGAKTAGIWSFSMLYNPSQAGGAAARTQAMLFKNGALYLAVTADATFCAQSGSIRVANGDTLAMAVWQNSGGARGNKNTLTTPYTFFNLYQISS